MGPLILSGSGESTSSPPEPVSNLKGGRYGSRLLRAGRVRNPSMFQYPSALSEGSSPYQVDAFYHMRSILGAGGSSAGGEEGISDKRTDVVHISVLQTMKFLQVGGTGLQWDSARIG